MPSCLSLLEPQTGEIRGFITHSSPGIAGKVLSASHAQVYLHPLLIFSSYEICVITNKNQPLPSLKKPQSMTKSHKTGLPGHASFTNHFERCYFKKYVGLNEFLLANYFKWVTHQDLF